MARYGGEKFVCVLPGTDVKGAVLLGEKLRGLVVAMNIPHAHSATADHVILSLGIATTMPAKNDD